VSVLKIIKICPWIFLTCS